MKDVKTEDTWREELNDNEFHICREKGTEPAFSGAYWNHWEEGTYRCRCCGEQLFDAEAKFDAGCGWPSFSQPLEKQAIDEEPDTSFAMRRTEVTCSNCGCHLGHVFPDGPAPTGLRYCINSASIRHEKD